MKLVSWNVNGLRACVKKGFEASVAALAPDVLCLQETKLQPGQLELSLPGCTVYWNSAEKKGYSGTAALVWRAPLQVLPGLGETLYDSEGRCLTLEYPDFFLVTVYAPNSRPGLARIDYRLGFEAAMLAHVKELDAKKPVILCGDLNVARGPEDLYDPAAFAGGTGCSEAERGALERLLDAGLLDTFRLFHPDEKGAYSWWDYRFFARERNAGWRLDYFLASARLAPRLTGARICSEVYGSDHCPVELTLL